MQAKYRKSRDFEPGLSLRYFSPVSGLEPALPRHGRRAQGTLWLAGHEAPPVAGRRRPLLLLACADDDLAGLLDAVAGASGYETGLALSGAEAVRQARALQPDILVLFPNLDDMDGLAVAQRLRADAEPMLARMRVLHLAYEASERNLLEAFQAGVDDVLRLPGDLSDLLCCWRQMLILPHRPSPLAALLNPDAGIAHTALSFLLYTHPPGLVNGLNELLVAPDPTARARAAWALQRLGALESRGDLVSQADAPGGVRPIREHGK